VREIFVGGYHLPKSGLVPSSLTQAAGAGHYDIVKLLLSQGATMDNRPITAETPSTPLQAAAAKGHTKIVRLLLNRGAKADANSDQSGSALRQAVENGHLDTVRTLVAFGANACPSDSHGQGVPLTCAHGPDRMEIIKV